MMMLTRQHFPLRVVAALVMIVTLGLASAPLASAQDEKRSSAFADVVKGVVFDPTTYAPALIGYDATMRDWNTSQPFFRNGYVEHNERFTVTGRPDDTALNYFVGRNQIFKDAVTAFGVTAAQNATSRVVERALLQRYPNHRKVVKSIGWIQRITVASLMSYHLSAPHYRQARINAQRAAELGLR
jgi:hypothetical protein